MAQWLLVTGTQDKEQVLWEHSEFCWTWRWMKDSHQDLLARSLGEKLSRSSLP
jgi:hypothetical protein